MNFMCVLVILLIITQKTAELIDTRFCVCTAVTPLYMTRTSLLRRYDKQRIYIFNVLWTRLFTKNRQKFYDSEHTFVLVTAWKLHRRRKSHRKTATHVSAAWNDTNDADAGISSTAIYRFVIVHWSIDLHSVRNCCKIENYEVIDCIYVEN